MKHALIKVTNSAISSYVDIKIVHNIDAEHYRPYKEMVNIDSSSGVTTKFRVFTLPKGKLTTFILDQINKMIL